MTFAHFQECCAGQAVICSSRFDYFTRNLRYVGRTGSLLLLANGRPMQTAKPTMGSSRTHRFAMAAGLTAVVLAIGVAVVDRRIIQSPLGSPPSTGSTDAPSSHLASKAAQAEVRLTPEAIDQLLNGLDQAKRRKDAEGILRHIAPDAIITIHMKQGSQQQIATLTREEYRATLHMSLAFPSLRDYARVSTNVVLAPDARSAKVSFKFTETLRQASREIKVEGEDTLVFRIRGDKPTIISLEQVFPGDST